MKAKTALIILHEDFEEVEAICPIDILDRGGVAVTLASREATLEVKGRSNVVIKADVLLDAVKNKTFDALILPGGPGTPRMVGDSRILEMVKIHHQDGHYIGAICAAPSVLQAAGIMEGHKYTAHPCTRPVLPNPVPNVNTVVDGQLITSYGPGGAM
ncbi:MAG: hypothetical protein B7X06_00155 [Verrucomicrobia bacterium 21-51-4]|nr:MAG: hypothetical protein B7X06_00155 [Verrucomicrobia bacterium 21-51-4]